MSLQAVSSDVIGAIRWQTLAPVLLDALALPSRPSVVAMGLARVGDPGATRTVYATVVILACLGVALLALAVWVFRRTRPESELLAPLETMQTRSWRKLDPAAQRRLLDEARPSGAAPLKREASEPAVDSSFEVVAPVGSFDDLSDRDGPDDAEAADVAEAVGAAAGARDAETADGDGVADTGSNATVDALRPVDGDQEGGVLEQDRAGDVVAAIDTADDTGELADRDEFGLEFSDDDLDIEPLDPTEEPDAADHADESDDTAAGVVDPSAVAEAADDTELDNELDDVDDAVAVDDVDDVDDAVDVDDVESVNDFESDLEAHRSSGEPDAPDSLHDANDAPPARSIDPLLPPTPSSPRHAN